MTNSKVLNSVAKVLVNRSLTFVAQRNSIVRVFNKNVKDYDKETKQLCFDVLESMKVSKASFAKVTDLIAASKKDTKVFKQLESACSFDLSFRKIDKVDTIFKTFKEKHILHAANTVLENKDSEKKNVSFKVDVLNALIAKHTKQRVNAEKKLTEKVVELSNAKDSKLLEYLRTQKSNIVTSIEKQKILIAFCEAEKVELTK